MNTKSLIESQEILRSVMSEAMGIYESKEPTEGDSWRHVKQWNLLQHLKHEIGEIEKSMAEPDRMYHNCLDAINLAAMLAGQVRKQFVWIILNDLDKIETVCSSPEKARSDLRDIQMNPKFYDNAEKYHIIGPLQVFR